MSLKNFIQYLRLAGEGALAADADKSARYMILKAMERAMPLSADTNAMVKEMAPKGKWSLTRLDHPMADTHHLNDIDKAFTLKIQDNARHKDWTALGQPNLKTMNEWSEDYATPAADKLGLSADQTEESLRKLQKIYGYVAHRHPEFPDAMIESKIPGFTKWMQKKKLERNP